MGKRIVALVLMFTIMMLSACQKTPEKVTENENGIKISDEKETYLNLESETTMTTEAFEAPDHISETYTEEDYTVNIESDIVLQTAAVTSGQLASEEISLETMKDVLNPNAEWILRDGVYYVLRPESEQQEDQVDYSTYLMKNQDIENQVTYDVKFTQDFPTTADFIEKSLWTEEQSRFYEEAKQYAENILQTLGYTYVIESGELWGKDTQWYASFGLVYALDGIPLCDLSSMGVDNVKSVSGQMSATTDQVGGLILDGDYSVAESTPVELLSLDSIIKCFVGSVGQGNAGKLLGNVNITKIQLEYWVNNDLSYVPVWTFYDTQEEAGGFEVPITCIQASTGEIMYQW